MTGTRQRTVTRQALDESRAAWDAGDFPAEWKPWRHLAAMQAGIIFPPDGTKWDSWGDESPTQRAMLVKAMRESPALLRTAIRRATRPSWAAVLEGVIKGWGDLADDVGERERQRNRQTPLGLSVPA